MAWELSAFELREEFDLEKHPGWFLEQAHTIPRWRPNDLDLQARHIQHGMCWALEELSYPTCKGWLWRIRDGSIYITPLATTESEAKQREPQFREKIKPFIEDPVKVCDQAQAELEGYWAKLDPIDVTKLPDHKLINHYLELIRVDLRNWELHFYLMYGNSIIYMHFENLVKELVGLSDMDPSFHKLFAGFENKTFECDKWLWQLGQKALELGLGDIFRTTPASEIVPKLKETEKGKKWLTELDNFLAVFGRRAYHLLVPSKPIWSEDPMAPIERMKSFMGIEGGEFPLEEKRKLAAQEREKTEKELISKIPADQRDWFSKLLHSAQFIGPFSEGHEWWMNDHSVSLLRPCLLEMGKRFVQSGTFDDVNDIFYLTIDEIRRSFYRREAYNWRPVVQARRGEWKTYDKKASAPVISSVGLDATFGYAMQTADPILLKIVVGSLPQPKPELKADFFGVCGSPGTAEGLARVVVSEEQLSEVQPGEILVAPCTYANWTPVFSLISGVVVDSGGSLAHASICAREYGIPCVLNTLEGTRKIKTGQRIKIDGNIGTVYILSETK